MEMDLQPCRVTAVHRGRYELDNAAFARLKPRVYYGGGVMPFPTVGDTVLTENSPNRDTWIIETLPRRSVFLRIDPGPIPRAQAVAANFDTVFILSSLNLDFNLKRIARYLTIARKSGGAPVVILSKADLTADPSAQVAAVQALASDVDVIPVSVVTGAGLDRVAAYMDRGQTVVFLGMSGVGKSSLLNAFMGREAMAVHAIREGDNRGRHTTTHRQMFTLPSGAHVIDTPGMRAISLWDDDTAQRVVQERKTKAYKQQKQRDREHRW
jgi:ribosome biogenesis GTPase